MADDAITTVSRTELTSAGHNTSRVKHISDTLTDPFKAYTYTSPLEHVLIVVFIAFVGLVGNGLTVHIFRRKIKRVGSTYILVLAGVDILALCTILPAYPFIKTFKTNYVVFFNIFLCLMSSVAVTCLWTLLAMTIERVVAVFRPFQLKIWRKPIERGIFGLGFIHVMLQVIRLGIRIKERNVLPEYGISFGSLINILNLSFTMISVFIIILAYPAIIYKLVQLGSGMMKCKDRKYTDSCVSNDDVRGKSEHGSRARRNNEHDVDGKGCTSKDIIRSVRIHHHCVPDSPSMLSQSIERNIAICHVHCFT